MGLYPWNNSTKESNSTSMPLICIFLATDKRLLQNELVDWSAGLAMYWFGKDDRTCYLPDADVFFQEGNVALVGDPFTCWWVDG